MITLKKVVIAIYAPIDAFPPTISLIGEFLNRNYIVSAIEVSEKQFLHKSIKVNKITNIKVSFPIPFFIRNYFIFLKFIFSFIELAKDCKEFVVFDAYSLYAYVLLKKIRILKPDSKIWYHNHDVALPSVFKLYSLGRLVHNKENFNLKDVDFFTLPSIERSIHFPKDTVKYILPNYPSLRLYEKFKSQKVRTSINLVFQGRITPGHGLESIIDLINDNRIEPSLNLVLKGLISDEYKGNLIERLSSKSKDRIKFIGYTEYEKLPEVTASCQIGVAIFQPTSFMHATLGTSSNKIYEYIACGLPILYLDNDHFNKYLRDFPWAFAVSDNIESIATAIIKIMENYNELSQQAKSDFLDKLNYEYCFNGAFNAFNAILK